MKKKILTFAISAIASLGFMASAQQQAPQNKMYTPQTFTDYAFEGVLLDLPQQQRIDSLHAAIRTPKMKKVNATTMCPDSARVKAQCQKQPQKPQKGMRVNGSIGGVMPGVKYVAKVKEILTPEQFDMFLSNIQAMPENVVYNLAPEMPQQLQQPARATKTCKSASQQCASANCAEQQCNSGNCQEQNCQTAGNCEKSKSKADKHHKDKKSGEKNNKMKRSK